MSKAHGKQSKKGGGSPSISPLSTLRPRLDMLWSSEMLSQQDPSSLYAGLDAVVQGMKPSQFLPIMIAAFLAAPAQSQARLDQILPGWLRDRGYLETLEDLIANQALDHDRQPQALLWLETAGSDTHGLAELAQQDLFYRAYYCGDDSQASIMLFWYTNPRRTRVQGFNFLVDYNPPWDGSVKDIILYPQRAPEKAMVEFVESWKARMPQPTELITAVEAKQKILEALACNREAGIRLPADLIATREPFIRYVLPLPDGPETPPFSVEDFDLLSQNGERPEAIRHFEQTVGRRVRMPDGKELLVMGGGLDWDE